MCNDPRLHFGWLPKSWSDIIGNQRAVKLLKGLSRRVNQLIDKGTQISNFHAIVLLKGPSRSGKTALIKHFMRSLVCDRLDPATLDPCDGSCPVCKMDPTSGAFAELFTFVSPRLFRSPVNLESIDCGWGMSPSELKGRLREARDRAGLNVMFLDEMHRLAKNSMDEMLLKHIEEVPALWILASAKTEEVEDMLKNRAIVVETQQPNPTDLSNWLKRRVAEAGLKAEDSAIDRLAAKVNRNPGLALLAITTAAAMQPDDGLTMDFVEDWKLPKQA